MLHDARRGHACCGKRRLWLLAEAAAAAVNLEGSIVGTAIYAGRFTLPEALEAVRRVDVTTRARADR